MNPNHANRPADDLDDLDDLDFDDLPDEENDDFDLETAIDHNGRVAACWTSGLSHFGLPELVIEGGLPEDGHLDSTAQAEQGLRWMQMLALLGRDVLAAQSLDVPPRREPVGGRMARFWLATPQEPEGPIAAVLPHVDEIVPVRWVID